MQKKEELYRGKTKAIFATDNPNFVVLQNFNALTKFDDPALTRQMDGKAVHATKTTCNVFQLLKDAGVPVAFIEQISETEFLANKCQMVPLEVIARRYAVGSFLKRYPYLETGEDIPCRFHKTQIEYFLKTTGKVIKTFDGRVLEQTTPVEDPLIIDRNEAVWSLAHPKTPAWEEDAILNVSVRPEDFICGSVSYGVKTIDDITKKTFLLLEGAWAQLGFRLIDFKIEFGVNENGEFVIADVIDNDSWRLRTNDWEEVSKECFRQNASMEEIGDKYAMVSRLSDKLRLPNQAIIVWRGSENDPSYIDCLPNNYSINVVDKVISAHKSPAKCLEALEQCLRKYPEGGVIIAMVGMSNGLGPILAARTSWPVISVPLTAENTPNDVWSSLSLPSNVPSMTILSRKNAVLAALNILAQKNPFAYMTRQFEIEKLDK